MYRLRAPIYHSNDKRILKIKKLFKEVLGYNSNEIDEFVKNNFSATIAKNLTLEQSKIISEIFGNNNISLYLENQENGESLYWNKIGIYLTKEPPKSHYCDEPLLTKDNRVNPFLIYEEDKSEVIKRDMAEMAEQRRQANTKPVVTCPYCQSTNTSKISVLSKAAHTTLFGLFSISRNAKQWHCNNCKSDF